jgi:hypothetical protein
VTTVVVVTPTDNVCVTPLPSRTTIEQVPAPAGVTVNVLVVSPPDDAALESAPVAIAAGQFWEIVKLVEPPSDTSTWTGAGPVISMPAGTMLSGA